MRQRFLIFGALISLVILLIGLNAVSIQQKQKLPDNEFAPNRSSYNSGTTGTQAFYSLLLETGRKVVRWQDAPSSLKIAGKNKPSVFVLVGRPRRAFTEEEAVDMYQWVYDGGRLVIIDREDTEFLKRSIGNWTVLLTPQPNDPELYGIDPFDQNQVIAKVNAAKPVQPSTYVTQVNAVQPSRFASALKLVRSESKTNTTGIGSGDPPPRAATPVPPPPPAMKGTPKPTPMSFTEEEDEYYDDESTDEEPVTAPPANRVSTNTSNKNSKTSPPREVYNAPAPPAYGDPGSPYDVFDGSAPVVHLANDRSPILADISYGAGKIVYLSDPYIVSNAGIGLVDNAQLAVNIVGTNEGSIAFDEYHQGYGSNSNRFFQYFAGTPVIAIFVQCIILVGFLFLSQSRRFARAVPEPEPSRLSKLEYVSAMAELQARTRAFDLAIENIYTDFRRRAARLLGVDNYTTTRKEMARLIAERAKLDPNDVEDVMFQCEDIMHGEPTDKKEILTLTGRLRAIEEKLGMKRAGKTRI